MLFWSTNVQLTLFEAIVVVVVVAVVDYAGVVVDAVVGVNVVFLALSNVVIHIVFICGI